MSLKRFFLRNDGEERAILLLTLLHREQRLKMPLRSIKSAGERSAQANAFAGQSLAGAKYA